MELDAFSSRLGFSQGRINPKSAVPVTGKWAFVLGEDEPGRFFNLTPGDYAQVIQDADLTGIDLVGVNLNLRVPANLPSGFIWEASIIVDGVKLARATAKPGRTRIITDLAANVSKLSEIHQIGIRLELAVA